MYPPQQNPNPERRFMNLSAGMLMLVTACVIILPIVGCVICCVAGGLGGLTGVDPDPSYSSVGR